jgi:sugar (pentulose or hexulose) kinase
LTRPAAYLGIDLGTSGCRGMAIDAAGEVLAEQAVALPPSRYDDAGGATQQPEDWWQAVVTVLPALLGELPDHQPQALAVDGTSASLLLTDADGHPLTAALMYDDSRAQAEAAQLATVAPADSAVHAASSSLAKLLWLSRNLLEGSAHALHQAEWIANRLTGVWGIGDENNCLKLGYDPVARRWPAWLDALAVDGRLLPRVVPAGSKLGNIDAGIARQLGLPADLHIVAGTTDSIAAALACGLQQVGDGATALGSTLAIKLLSDRPVFAPEYGIYSHRILDHWLVGGASNSGGAVLRQFFTDAQMAQLAARLDPRQPTGLDYYPLPRPGERFPVNNPQLLPRLTPRPQDNAQFFQGLLEGIAAIEAAGYRRLAELGAPRVSRVYTTGGGANNIPWQHIRQRLLGVPVVRAPHRQAAYGAALLAQRACIA